MPLRAFWLINWVFLRLQKEVMKKKDERMKLTNETINGIKNIKMSGWEEHFLDRVFI